MSNNVEEGSKLKIGHWGSKIGRCEDCDMDFFDKKYFDYHMYWHKNLEYYCEACDVYATCQKTYDQHLIGRKHLNGKKPNRKEMKNFRKANPDLFKYYCKVCNVYAYCQKTFDLHLNGRKHKESKPYKFHCKICNVSTPTQNSYDVHLAGQKHRKKIFENENGENWRVLTRKGPTLHLRP